MIKVTALTSGKDFPSSRFRIRQFIAPLRAQGIAVSEHYPLVNKYHLKRLAPLGMLARLPGVIAARSSSITWFERELLPGQFTLERYAGKKRLVDIDDALWLNAPRFSERLAELCDGVVAGNEFIAEHYRRCGARVWTVPTSVDSSIWQPAVARARDEWTIGWTGTSSNLKYLYLIAEPLAGFLAQHPEARLLIVCDKKPSLPKLPAGSWRFVQWSSANEVALIQSLDVGLMPLPDMEWTRGKCALKLIMYMAVGIPSVISPVGVGKEILDRHEVALAALSANDWFAALTRLLKDGKFAARLGANGRRLVEKEFSVATNTPRIAAVIREIAG